MEPSDQQSGGGIRYLIDDPPWWYKAVVWGVFALIIIRFVTLLPLIWRSL